MALKNKTLAKLPFKSMNDGASDFWTVSGSGTGEYYYNQLDLTYKPLNVQENNIELAEGTVGSLNAGEWAWADNDTIGNNVLYVRLSDDADPDSKAADFVKASEFIQIYQATSGLETINLSIIIANNEAIGDDAYIVLAVQDNLDVLQFSMQFDLKATDSAILFNDKIVMEPEHKLKILCDREYMSVSVSEDES